MVSQEVFNAGSGVVADHSCGDALLVQVPKQLPTTVDQRAWGAVDQAVLELCDRLGLPPQRCALVGDAETDLQMALEAGIGGVIGFTGGWKRAPELPSAQHLLHSWTDLVLSTGA